MGADCGNIVATLRYFCGNIVAELWRTREPTGETEEEDEEEDEDEDEIARLGLLLFFIFPLSSRRIGPHERADQLILVGNCRNLRRTLQWLGDESFSYRSDNHRLYQAQEKQRVYQPPGILRKTSACQSAGSSLPSLPHGLPHTGRSLTAIGEGRATDGDLATEVQEILRCQRNEFPEVCLAHGEVVGLNDEFRVFHLGSLSILGTIAHETSMARGNSRSKSYVSRSDNGISEGHPTHLTGAF